MRLLEELAGEADGRLRVAADLAVDVDGTPLRLRGEGRRLALLVDDPSALRTAARATDVREVARLLESLGLHVEVRSPIGTLAELGAGVAGPASRLLGAPLRPGIATTSLLPATVRVALLTALCAAVLWAIDRSRRSGD